MFFYFCKYAFALAGSFNLTVFIGQSRWRSRALDFHCWHVGRGQFSIDEPCAISTCCIAHMHAAFPGVRDDFDLNEIAYVVAFDFAFFFCSVSVWFFFFLVLIFVAFSIKVYRKIGQNVSKLILK